METSNIALLALLCSVVIVHAYKTDAPDFSNEPLTTLPPITPQQQLYILLLNFVSGNLPPGAPLPAGLLGPVTSGQNIPTMSPNVQPPSVPPPGVPPLGVPPPGVPPANMQFPNMQLPTILLTNMPATPSPVASSAAPGVVVIPLANLAPVPVGPSDLSPEITKESSINGLPF